VKTVRAAMSVDGLESEVFGSGNITWWAALLGEVIEGVVMLLTVFAFFYLRRNSFAWPPEHTPLPSIGVPTINLVLMIASIAPAYWAAKRAKVYDRTGTLIGLAGHTLIGTAILVLRYYECRALNVRWDTNAYGSVTWALLFTHGYMALFDVMDTAGLVLLFARVEPAEKHYVDVTENSFFWYFVLATWLPLYLLIFIAPSALR